MRRIAVVLAALLVLGLAAAAWASIPGPGGVINGCRKNSDGSIKVIDSAATCGNGYTALNWNQTGPPGISGYEVVSTSATPVEVAQGVWVAGPVTAACPSGKRILGGGAQTGNTDVDLSESFPNGDGWRAAANAPSSAFQLNVYAICGSVTT